jgi:hypothetical protein
MTEQQAKSLREAIAYTAPELLEWKLGLLIDDAIAAEREACAKIADDAAPTSRGSHAEGGRMTCAQIAAAIRARSTLKE